MFLLLGKVIFLVRVLRTFAEHLVYFLVSLMQAVRNKESLIRV